MEDGIAAQRENQPTHRNRAEETDHPLMPGRCHAYERQCDGNNTDERIDAVINARDNDAQNRERPQREVAMHKVWDLVVPADRFQSADPAQRELSVLVHG